MDRAARVDWTGSRQLSRDRRLGPVGRRPGRGLRALGRTRSTTCLPSRHATHRPEPLARMTPAGPGQAIRRPQQWQRSGSPSGAGIRQSNAAPGRAAASHGSHRLQRQPAGPAAGRQTPRWPQAGQGPVHPGRSPLKGGSDLSTCPARGCGRTSGQVTPGLLMVAPPPRPRAGSTTSRSRRPPRGGGRLSGRYGSSSRPSAGTTARADPLSRLPNASALGRNSVLSPFASAHCMKSW